MKKNLSLLISILFCSMAASAQWNTDTSVNNSVTPLDITCNEFMLKTNQNGVTYAFLEIPAEGNITKRLQILDKEGKKLFEDKGLLISNEKTETFSVVDEHILIDDEGNAIILVHDFRNEGSNSYTLYKYDEKGNKLWGDVKLNGGKPLINASNSSMCTTDDGGYVIAYMRTISEFDISDAIIQIEKFDKKGNRMWDPIQINKLGEVGECTYPYIVNTGDGTCTVVYFEGSNNEIRARKLDAEGKAVWNEETVVYDCGNWGNKPAFTMTNVIEGPDNGLLVTWQDLRGEYQNYQNCLAYIKSDGTHAFATGSEGTIISELNEYSRKHPSIFYDDKEKAFFCFFRVYNQARQEQNGLYMQKISYDGTRMWGDKGIAVKEIQNSDIYDFCNIKNIDDNRFAVFYQEHVGIEFNNKTNSYIKIYDKDGNLLADQKNFSQSGQRKSSLHTSEIIDGKYFLADWWEIRRIKTSESSLPIHDLYMQRIEISGTSTGIENIGADDNANRKTEIYSIDGKKTETLTNGVNIVRTMDAEGNVEVRKIVR